MSNYSRACNPPARVCLLLCLLAIASVQLTRAQRATPQRPGQKGRSQNSQSQDSQSRNDQTQNGIYVGAVESLNTRIRQLELHEEALRMSVRDSRDSLLFIVKITLAIVSVFYGLTTFLQYQRELRERADNKERSQRQDEENKKYLTLIKEQEGARLRALRDEQDRNDRLARERETRTEKLIDSVRENITRSTQLVGSLDQIFNAVAKAEELRREFQNLQNSLASKESANAAARIRIVRRLNQRAAELCSSINRDSYKSHFNQQRIAGLCQELSVHATDEDLNANGHLLLGLDWVLKSQFEPALVELRKATEQACKFMDVEPPDIMYPGIPIDKRKSWSLKLANICLFHQAIVLYNLGQYGKSEKLFKEALNFDERDAKAMLYIPEAKYLGHLEPHFEGVVESFENTKAAIESIDVRDGWREPLHSLLAQLFVRYGNCYFPGSTYAPYQRSANLRIAEIKYAEAYRYAPDSYITKFSYAQALKLKAMATEISKDEQRHAVERSTILFQEVSSILRVKVGETTEPKILMMLYYILAICAKEAKGTESPTRYLAQVFEQGGRLPPVTEFRIFSPLTKNDLTYMELKKELKAFEESLREAPFVSVSTI